MGRQLRRCPRSASAQGRAGNIGGGAPAPHAKPAWHCTFAHAANAHVERHSRDILGQVRRPSGGPVPGTGTVDPHQSRADYDRRSRADGTGRPWSRSGAR